MIEVLEAALFLVLCITIGGMLIELIKRGIDK